MSGILGTRGDLLSDLLILALGLVVPALLVAVWLGRTGRRRAHQLLMVSLVAVLVTYVVVYEANLLMLGGMDYLARVTHMARGPYYAMVGGHVLIGLLALVTGGWAIRRGLALRAAAPSRPHRRMGWTGVALLGTSSVTGVVVYWATFVA